MAEMAVNLVIDKLIPLLRDEVALLRGVRGQITSIKDQLKLIRAYLKDADEKAERANSIEVEKEWVLQMRHVSFRIEDVIDEYLFNAAARRRQSGCTAAGVVCKICDLLKTVISRHDISSQIGDIQKSIEGLSKAKDTFGFNPSPSESTAGISRGPGPVDLRLGAHFMEDDHLVGVDRTKQLLTGWLSEGQTRCTVISIVGEGGLGKTTIAKNVYNEQKKGERFNCYAWITVSHSLKGAPLLKTLMQSFHEEDGKKSAPKEISEAMGKKSLIEIVRGHLRGKSCLIVFDDVWEEESLGDIQFALPADSESRIIITTRNKGVAEFCKSFASSFHILDLEPLDLNDGLKLFHLKAFPFDGDQGCPQELMVLSQEFVKKCVGVPLAIVAIAGLLSTKEKIASEWQKVYDSLRSRFSSNNDLESYDVVLSESYNDLPYNLKLCLLYFGLFPEDYSIRCGRLYDLWIAEGFTIKGKEKEGQVAEKYLKELIRRNLVKVAEENDYGGVKSCRVHDLMHDFILKKCQELDFCQVKEEGKEGFSFNEWSRRLSIHGDIGTMNDYGRVRSCFVFNSQDMATPNKVELLLSRFKLLIGLDCEDAPIDHLPEAVGNLLHLKYLKLRNTKIKTIPKSIGKLRKLESLDLRDTEVHELPIEINRLTKLRRLLAYSIDPSLEPWQVHGMKLNEGIGGLGALEKLGAVEVSDDGDGIIRELKNLKQMTRLIVSELRRQDGQLLCSAIECMTHLQALEIIAAREQVLDLQSLTNPPQHLQRLYLHGRLEKLPEWIPRLGNLVKLVLHGSRLKANPLPLLKDLLGLKVLILWGSYEGPWLHFRVGWFMNLRTLGLGNMPWVRIKIDKGAMPHLRVQHYTGVMVFRA